MGALYAGVDYSGLEDVLVTGWHRKLHIFQVPFYYMEYGLAQLGAVQVWPNALKDQAGSVRSYRKALALGGTVTLPELYRTAGARLAFDAETLGQSVKLMESTINDLRTKINNLGLTISFYNTNQEPYPFGPPPQGGGL